MGIFKNRKKPKVYTLGESIKLAKDPRYEQYEFVLVNSNDIQAGYIPILREEVRSYIDEIKKSKKNSEFEKYVTGDGSYKNIDRNVSKNLATQRYNNYQSAKRYKPNEFELG